MKNGTEDRHHWLWRHGALACEQRGQAGGRGVPRGLRRGRAAAGQRGKGIRHEAVQDAGRAACHPGDQLCAGGDAQSGTQGAGDRGAARGQERDDGKARDAVGRGLGRDGRGQPRVRQAAHRAPEPPLGQGLPRDARGDRKWHHRQGVLHREPRVRHGGRHVRLARVQGVRRRHGAGLGRAPV